MIRRLPLVVAGVAALCVLIEDVRAQPARVLAQGSPALRPVRQMAVTFDDLPAVRVARGDPTALAAFTHRLLANFARRKVPVVGFVNEGKLTVPGEDLAGRQQRVGLLAKWVSAGFERGNHTYSHRSLNDLPIEEFEADVMRGEPTTATLMAGQGRRLRYFRQPFLQVGLDLRKRRAFESWLQARGYAVAPVTIDNDDYVGGWGISWTHHWEQAMGRPRTGSPDPPSRVSEAYEEGRQ